MALKAGKHILVEKPFAMKSSDAQRVLRLHRKKDALHIPIRIDDLMRIFLYCRIS